MVNVITFEEVGQELCEVRLHGKVKFYIGSG